MLVDCFLSLWFCGLINLRGILWGKSYTKPCACGIQIGGAKERQQAFLEKLVRSFRLSVCLGVISRGHSMFNPQFLQAFTKVFAREVCSSVAYQDSQDAISREDYRFNHVWGLLRWCLPTWHSFNPLWNIVHHHQYMLKPMWVHEWSHEIDSPDIK